MTVRTPNYQTGQKVEETSIHHLRDDGFKYWRIEADGHGLPKKFSPLHNKLSLQYSEERLVNT